MDAGWSGNSSRLCSIFLGWEKICCPKERHFRDPQEEWPWRLWPRYLIADNPTLEVRRGQITCRVTVMIHSKRATSKPWSEETNAWPGRRILPHHSYYKVTEEFARRIRSSSITSSSTHDALPESKYFTTPLRRFSSRRSRRFFPRQGMKLW